MNRALLRAPLRCLWLRFSLALPLIASLTTTACSKGNPGISPSTAAAAAVMKSEAAALPAADTSTPDTAPLPHIDAKRAFQYTREVTAFGPRYMGNEAHKKLERYILDHLKEDHLEGDQIEEDDFTADTVEGKFPVHNIIAKFPGKKDGIIA